MLSRRGLLLSGGALAVSACSKSREPKVPETLSRTNKIMSVTMDDFALDFDIRMTPTDRNAAILAAFAVHNHKAVGFVTGKHVDSGAGRDVVQSWSDAGHMIGNHSWSHLNSSDEDTDIIKADILRNHEFLSQFPAYEKVFRFPFLAEGGSPEKETDYRGFMAANGFANAPVTIDSVDWFTTSRMETRLRENPEADLSGYRDYYIQFVRDVSEQKHQLALSLGYDNLPHTLLVHHNILNGLFLKDVMDALVGDGWRFVDAETALDHPLYKLQPKTPNNGRSVLSVLANEQGIEHNYPKKYYGFGEEYMESLGL